MVCDATTSRLNGAKSKGPKTTRGKAIASKNATKHGLLAQQPPLLATEDLGTFEGMVQGLIDHYQPDSPIEHFLIQQIAMGMLKQHRLWSVEAAIANIEILKAQRQQQFPDHVVPAFCLDLSGQHKDQRIPRQDLYPKEQALLMQLIAEISHDLSNIGKVSNLELIESLQASLLKNYFQEARNATVWQLQSQLEDWCAIELANTSDDLLLSIEDADVGINLARELLAKAQERLQELAEAIAQLEAVDADLQQAEAAAKGIQQPELFNRYQREISRGLYEAIDRLLALQEQKGDRSSVPLPMSG